MECNVIGFLVIYCCHSVDAQKIALDLLPRKQAKSLVVNVC